MEHNAVEKQYYKPNFGPEETEQDVMANLNASRNKVMKTREELQKQIEDRRLEKEMIKQAKLEQERFEGQLNQQELQNMKDRSE